jgi:hypothetical protein
LNITKDILNVRICDLEHTANTQTYREFVRESEEEFGLIEMDLESIDDYLLEQYLAFLDDLWLK